MQHVKDYARCVKHPGRLYCRHMNLWRILDSRPCRSVEHALRIDTLIERRIAHLEPQG